MSDAHVYYVVPWMGKDELVDGFFEVAGENSDERTVVVIDNTPL